MCTAISLTTQDHYFGRNLDLEYSYIETITISPRNFPFSFHQKDSLHHHYAIIGTAFVQDNYPLYYDATNEKGLSMAGLNFPENAYYFPSRDEKDNITPYVNVNIKMFKKWKIKMYSFPTFIPQLVPLYRLAFL